MNIFAKKTASAISFSVFLLCAAQSSYAYERVTIDTGMAFLYNVDPNVAKHYFPIFDEFGSAVVPHENEIDFDRVKEVAAQNGMGRRGLIDRKYLLSVSPDADALGAVNKLEEMLRDEMNCQLSGASRGKMIDFVSGVYTDNADDLIYGKSYRIYAGVVVVKGNSSEFTLVPMEFFFLQIGTTYWLRVEAIGFTKTMTH